MSVNVAVLKETQPHERRVALTPAIAGERVPPGARRPLPVGAGDASKVPAAALEAVVFGPDRHALVRDAAAVPARMIDAVRGWGAKAAA